MLRIVGAILALATWWAGLSLSGAEAAETKTLLTSLTNPAVVGSEVVFVADIVTSAGTPTGTITLSTQSIELTSRPVNGKRVEFKVSSLPFGVHYITATYSGDATFGGSRSDPLVQDILFATPSTTTISSGTFRAAQDIVLEATVESDAAKVSGWVDFVYDNVLLGSAEVAPPPAPLDVGMTEQDVCVLDRAGTLICRRAGQAERRTGYPLLAKLAPGYMHQCAVDLGGTVWCFGNNDSLQLGGTSNATGLVAVSLLPGRATAVATTYKASCAILESGEVWCWGAVPRARPTASAVPVRIQGYTGKAVSIVGGGEHVCILTDEPNVYCFGENANGQLGNGSTSGSASFSKRGLSGPVSVHARDRTTCARTAAGLVYCWGDNTYGALGSDRGTSVLTPTRLATGTVSRITDVAVGNRHICLLSERSEILCAGYNSSGQLGDSTIYARATFASVAFLGGGFSKLSTTSFGTCAIRYDVSIYCWGAYAFMDNSLVPIRLARMLPHTARLKHQFKSTHDAAILSAEYGGDGLNKPSAATTAITVYNNPSTLTVSVDAGTSAVVSQPITFDIAVTGAVEVAPTGFVSVSSDRGGSTSVPLVGGTARLTTASLPVGTTLVSVRYPGDQVYQTTTTSVPLTIIRGLVSVALRTSQNPGYLGRPNVATIQVRPVAPATSVDDAAVVLMDGAGQIASSHTNMGTATVDISRLAVGTHPLMAQYSGTSSFEPSSSTILQQVVKAVGQTSVDLSISPTSPGVGETIEFTARVAPVPPWTGVPEGNVEFYAGRELIGTVALKAGVAVARTSSLRPGTHVIEARYLGFGPFDAAVGSATVAVGRAATETTLTPHATRLLPYEPLQLSVAVSPKSGQGAVEGTVEFFDGDRFLGRKTLRGGKATVSSTGLTSGPHTFRAVYSGSTDHAGSEAASAAVTISGAVGGRLLVNATRKGPQGMPSVAREPNGVYGVLWTSRVTDGTGVFRQRFLAAGGRVGTEEKVDADPAEAPSVARQILLEGGRRLIVWSATAGAIEARFTDRSGALRGPAKPLVRQVAGKAPILSVAAARDGGFLLAWDDRDARGDPVVRWRKFDSVGAPSGSVGEVVAASQPVLGALPDGTFIIVHVSTAGDGARRIRGQRLTGAGAANGEALTISRASETANDSPDLAVFNDGGFAVAWAARRGPSPRADILLQRFDVAGRIVGVRTVVGTSATADNRGPRIAVFPSGGAVVVWSAVETSLGRTRISTQRLDGRGELCDVEVQVATLRGVAPASPAVATLSARAYVVVWTGAATPKTEDDILAQNYLLGADAGNPL